MRHMKKALDVFEKVIIGSGGTIYIHRSSSGIHCEWMSDESDARVSEAFPCEHGETCACYQCELMSAISKWTNSIVAAGSIKLAKLDEGLRARGFSRTALSSLNSVDTAMTSFNRYRLRFTRKTFPCTGSMFLVCVIDANLVSLSNDGDIGIGGCGFSLEEALADASDCFAALNRELHDEVLESDKIGGVQIKLRHNYYQSLASACRELMKETSP